MNYLNRVLKIVTIILVSLFTLVGIVSIALLIYYYPVIDRLFIQPCSYYPEMFKDCKE